MIVQHIIDWAYVRRLVSSANDTELDLLRTRLFYMRKHIERCGVLIKDFGGGSLRELDGAVKDLCQDGESEPVQSWIRMYRELDAYKSLYRDRALNVGTDRALGLSGVVCALGDFLHATRLEDSALPGIAVTDDAEQQLPDGYQRSTIDSYEEVSTRIGWRDSETFGHGDDQEFDRLMAEMSLVASCFGEITFQDPYLYVAFNMSDAGHNPNTQLWQVSTWQLLKRCVHNPKITSITLVTEVNSLVDKNCHINWLKKQLLDDARSGRSGRRGNESLRLKLHFCKENQNNHNRHVYVGDNLPGWQFPHGIDVFDAHGKLRAGRVFEVVRKSWDIRQRHGRGEVIHEIMRLPRHAHSDALQLADKGKFSCDMENWQTLCKPTGVNSTFEFKFTPPIVVRLTDGGLR